MKWVLKIDTLSERVQLSKECGQEQPETQEKFARPIPSYELRYVQITIAVPFKAGAPDRVSTSSSAQDPARAWNLMLSASQALDLSFPIWFFTAAGGMAILLLFLLLHVLQSSLKAVKSGLECCPPTRIPDQPHFCCDHSGAVGRSAL